MKTVKQFRTALSRCADADVLYVSIGSDRILNQQLPRGLLDFARKDPSAKVCAIACSPSWTVTHPSQAPGIKLQYVSAFFSSPLNKEHRTQRSDEGLLADYINENKRRVVILGDFTMTGPFPRDGISDNFNMLYRIFVKNPRKLTRTTLLRVTDPGATSFTLAPHSPPAGEKKRDYS